MSARHFIVLCPGQGAQYAGMGRDWAARLSAAKAVFDEADAVLGDSLGATLSELCFDGPQEQLDRTDIAQPAIYATSVACFRGLEQRDGPIHVVAAAGLSLGEYTALHLAGVFCFADGLRVVAARGRLMQDAAEVSGGSMVALSGDVTEDAVTALCEQCRGDDVLVPANYNSPMQVVLSGSEQACRRAAAAAEAAGFKATPLPVAGAFHSPLMQPAADQMGEVLADIAFESPQSPVWSNVSGNVHESSNMELLRTRLVEQIVQPVRWQQLCQDMKTSNSAAEPLEWIELCPRTTLRGLMKRIDRDIKVTSHDQP